MQRSLFVCWLLILTVTLAARDRRPLNTPIITDLPDCQLRVHRASNMLFSVTNFGVIGSYGGNLPDAEGIFAVPPGMEFPAYSNIGYLYFGAIWIGGVIDTFDSGGNPILDTLVSVGNDPWWSNIYELYPARPGGEPSMWRDRNVSDEEIFAVYSDTVTDPGLVSPDPIDARPHIPLGVTVHQHSFCWSSVGYNEIFIIEYAIENIYNRPLHDVWLGIYYDGDVYHSSENPYFPDQGAQDDLCGFIGRENSRGIAWLADNDGQPYDGQYDYRSPTGVMGITFLDPRDNREVNFNWWISNPYYQDWDWGPRRIENGTDPFPGGGMGTPGGDKARYQVMSNGEQDYDQAWSAIPHEGWIDPSPAGQYFAEGDDIGYLISFGPLQLAAGQIETVTVALIGGNNLHTDPQNYSEHLLDHTTDSSQIAQYYEGLDFSDLIAKADSAYSFHQYDYAQIPIGPPENFRVSGWNTNQINLAWSPSWCSQIREYRLYRAIIPGQYSLITPDNFTDTTFIDAGLEDNTRYYYIITTVKDNGIEGGRSRVISFNTGQPQTPTGLTAARGNARVTLTWQANEENDIAGYIIDRWMQAQLPESIDTVGSTTYIDNGLQNGLAYNYYISALDNFGNESFNSPEVSIVPMGFDSGILLINMNRLGPYNPDYDSMTAFYERALHGREFTVAYGSPGSLSRLAPYSTVIWSRDLILGNPFVNYSNIPLFQSYLDNGGKLIIEGTRNLVVNPWFEDTTSFGEGDFRYDYLNLAGVEYPDTAINSEFIGAWTNQPDLPQAEVDNARANRIVYPQVQNDGRLFGIGTLIPRNSSEAFYYFNAVNPDTSRLQDLPVATLHMGEDYILATFEFPLYYIREPASIEILRRILGEFGELGVDENTPLPEEFALLQNYPNPFNAQTTISFDLPHDGSVSLVIFNVLGQVVATLLDGSISAGRHGIVWNAAGLPSGLYFARLQYGEKTGNIKMLLLK